MNNKAIILLLILLSFHASAMAPAGRWSPIINVKDPHIVKVGEFAVSEYDMQSKSELKFVAVVSGDSKVVAGTSYRLIVAAYDSVAGPGASKNYEAIVWEKEWLKSMNLTSFTPVV
ncbi:Cysteine proteinase inhibitor 5 [Hirschfeldia incana]|nr:Cysteine proteinase inhibitor 5 [Hirschfeldia incana]